MKKDVCTVEYDTTPQFSMSVADTKIKTIKSSGMTHAEGGWSADVDATNREQTSRLRKRFAKAGIFTQVIKHESNIVDFCANQNTTVDIYEEYFPDDTSGMTQAHLGVHEVALIKDPTAGRSDHQLEGSSRSVTDLQWSPTQSNVLAAAYGNLNNMKSTTTEHLQSFLWDVRRSNAPIFELLPSSPVRCLAYGSDGRYLLAGTTSGLVSIFDPRSGSHATKTSSIEHSHNDPICDITWTHSKSGTECASVSSDGQLFFWDSRKLDKPVEALRLMCPTAPSARGQAMAGIGDWSNHAIAASSSSLFSGLQLTGSSMNYSVAAGHQKLLVGTEQGIILLCNQHDRTTLGKGGAVGGEGPGGQNSYPGKDVVQSATGNVSSENNSAFDSRINAAYTGHLSSVRSVLRHPQFPRYFLSSGDWTSRIWSERHSAELLSTPHHHSRVVSACWSPTRPALFYSASVDGNLYAWDLLMHQDRPSLSYDIGMGVVCMKPRDGGLLAVGSVKGSISLLELSSGMSQPQAHEKKTMGQLLERLQGVVSSRSQRSRIEAKKKGSTSAKEKENRVSSLLAEQNAESIEHEVDCACKLVLCVILCTILIAVITTVAVCVCTCRVF